MFLMHKAKNVRNIFNYCFKIGSNDEFKSSLQIIIFFLCQPIRFLIIHWGVCEHTHVCMCVPKNLKTAITKINDLPPKTKSRNNV